MNRPSLSLTPAGLLRLRSSSPDGYVGRLLEMFAAGELPRASVACAAVYHDDDCSIFGGGPCDCDPEIVIKPTATVVGTEREEIP